jgi:UDP-2,3-diacylglucosamine pyrophosphatase LpxH
MPKLSLIFSDTEAGDGGHTDDFIDDALFYETIANHFEESEKYPSDLILNGDIIDFMKTPYKGTFPRHITEKVSVGKLKRVVKAHPVFFQAMTDWLKASKTNRIVIVTGNHDYDLIFPKVQEHIRKVVSGGVKAFKERIVFPGFEFKDNLLLVEHGSQLDHYFRVDPEKFIHKSKYHDEPFLLLPWGFNALYDHFIHIHGKYPMLDRIQPRIQIFEALPMDLRRELYLDSTVYMLKSFFYTQFRHWRDVLYRFPPHLFFKYLFSFLRKDFELKISGVLLKLTTSKDVSVLSIGHNHRSKFRKLGRKKFLLNTGAWRDEYTAMKKFRKFVPKPKSYGYVLHNSKKILDVKLVMVPAVRKILTMKDLKGMLRGIIPAPGSE